MRMNSFITTVLLLAGLQVIGQSEMSTVFTSGTEGHKTYRIPAIIKMPSGVLLAFAEGRVKGSGDFGDINIVMKRSVDQGKTWMALETIVNFDSLQAGNPAPVVDLSDPEYPRGRIFLFYNTGNNHEGEVRKGKGLREVWFKTSVDDGKTWSEATNITWQTHRPLQPKVNESYNFMEDWRSYANTPGHATQLTTGIYKGRIYVAANHSTGNPKPHFEDYFAHGYYTDDHGKSFHLSEVIAWPGGNEATATEISGGRLMLNARNQKGDNKARLVGISKDGGSHWDTVYMDRNLPDPVCEGSILTIGKKGKKNILAFSNAADTVRRNNLTLRISFDDGQTWVKKFLVDAAPSAAESNRDFTAYSDIVVHSKNSIGVLYERDGYTQIVYKVIKWK